MIPPPHLKVLFFLNGAVQSFPLVALSTYLNSIAKIDINLLSLYGASCFLPYLLKPFYATVLCVVPIRPFLVACYVLSALSFIFTALAVTDNAQAVAFVVGFSRSLTQSAADFALTVVLLEYARVHYNFKKPVLFKRAVAYFQSEAATCRNVGSFVASLGCAIVFGIGNSTASAAQAKSMLLLTAVLPAVAAILTVVYFDEVSSISTTSSKSTSTSTSGDSSSDSGSDDDDNTESLLHPLAPTLTLPPASVNPPPNPPPQPNFKLGLNEIAAAVLIQLLLVMVAFFSTFPSQIFVGVFVFVAMLLFFVIYNLFVKNMKNNNEKQNKQIKVGMFLVFRMLAPTFSYQYRSYSYGLFESKAAYLQILSLVSSSALMLGGMFFQRYIAKKTDRVGSVFVVTTILAVGGSLSFLVMCGRAAQDRSVEDNFAWAIPITFVTGFLGEVAFLPSVMLASCSLVGVGDRRVDEMIWALFTAAIDFGNELSDWILVVLVDRIGISREDWSGLPTLLFVCGGFSLATLGVLPLIRV
ncbi:hypothetical protein ScalyP_jg10512 [Parmales sp. scaly parma]|nr:hypothetical protein ScalyP_jg10512 [Parmales sp. scaly parma]